MKMGKCARVCYGIIGLCAVFVFVYLVLSVVVRPSTDRDWTDDQKILAHTTFLDNGTAFIENIRNIDYESTTVYTPAYYDSVFDPEKIIRAWFIIEPFGRFGAAHTFVSFEFEDSRFVSISAEIRKEKGESFSPLMGLLRQYEIVYVVADEHDVLRLRTNYRKDPVFLYPIKGDAGRVREVFRDMLHRANSLAENPEMYNTLTNNCTTNIVSHVRKFSDKKIPWWDMRYLFPATVDEVAYEVGLIDTALTLEGAREYFLVTRVAQENDDNPDFSKAIRESFLTK